MAWDKSSPGRPTGNDQNVAIGAASVQNGTAFQASTQMLRLSAMGNCHIAIGTNPTASASSMLLKATDPATYVRIAQGEKVAVIQDGSSTGNLNISEWTF